MSIIRDLCFRIRAMGYSWKLLVPGCSCQLVFMNRFCVTSDIIERHILRMKIIWRTCYRRDREDVLIRAIAWYILIYEKGTCSFLKTSYRTSFGEVKLFFLIMLSAYSLWRLYVRIWNVMFEGTLANKICLRFYWRSGNIRYLVKRVF